MSSILLIQSDPAACAYLGATLGADPSFAISGAVGSLALARAFIAKRIPDLLIADLRLRDGRFVDLLRELRPARSHVLVVTASLRDPHLMHALRHGADAYLLQGQPCAETRTLVRAVLAGESPMAPAIARRCLEHFGAAGTARASQRLAEVDRRLLQWLRDGYLVEEIARGLDLTPRQVGVRIRALYRTLRGDPSGAPTR
jgi:DNA-binding NarL/FixJ family response regulator